MVVSSFSLCGIRVFHLQKLLDLLLLIMTWMVIDARKMILFYFLDGSLIMKNKPVKIVTPSSIVWIENIIAGDEFHDKVRVRVWLLLFRHCGDIFCATCTLSRAILPRGFGVRDPQRVCVSCNEVLRPYQQQFIREFSNQSRINAINPSNVAQQHFSLPYSKTLGSEIRKAVFSLYNYLEQDIIQDSSTSLSILRDAKGIAILTVAKAGFIFAPRFGTGLVMSRLLDGR